MRSFSADRTEGLFGFVFAPVDDGKVEDCVSSELCMNRGVASMKQVASVKEMADLHIFANPDTLAQSNAPSSETGPPS
jgi:hypothetical protein